MPTASILPALIALAWGADAVAQAAPAEDARLLAYAEPGRRVDVGGRRINMHCMGAGRPTVVLMSGLSSWSPVWYKTQPEIAKRVRVCTFDKAGYGFSDPAPRAQIVADVAEDLRAGLKASGETGPYVLVGHSLGGLEARVFAERWPGEVAGMVMVDSHTSAQNFLEITAPGYQDVSRERYASAKLRCLFLAVRGVDPTSPDYQECVVALPGDTPAAFRKVWPTLFTAEHAAAQLSLFASLWTHRYDSADRLQLGDKPMVVLSMDLCCEDDTPSGRFWRGYAAQWYAQHRALARLSSRGVHRVVSGAGHQIELDRPQAVIDSVDEVLRALAD